MTLLHYRDHIRTAFVFTITKGNRKHGQICTQFINLMKMSIQNSHQAQGI